MKKVWVLTREHNGYDQAGEYFEAVWAKRPEVRDLASHFSVNGDLRQAGVDTFTGAVALLDHIRVGGGRQKSEEVWWHLKEVEVK